MASNQGAKKEDIQVKPNARGITEMFIEGKHTSVEELKIKIQNDSTLWLKIEGLAGREAYKLKSSRHEDKPKILDYLENVLPKYPTPVEFHVSAVTHVTTKGPFQMIMESQEFRPPKNEFAWWSLQINDEEIKSAEKCYLQKKCPNLTPEQIESHEPVLDKFTNSPVFQSESRYGNYKFTFPLTELMDLYKEQNCGGEEPVLRVFKTMFYKQEILYAVLIHSPQENELFKGLPLLEESQFAHYEDGKMIWCAQAISNNIEYEIATSHAGVEVEGIDPGVFNVWDHVCLAFYLPLNPDPSVALKVPFDNLVGAIEACKLHKMNLITNKTAKREELYKEAVKVVNEEKNGAKVVRRGAKQ